MGAEAFIWNILKQQRLNLKSENENWKDFKLPEYSIFFYPYYSKIGIFKYIGNSKNFFQSFIQTSDCNLMGNFSFIDDLKMRFYLKSLILLEKKKAFSELRSE